MSLAGIDIVNDPLYRIFGWWTAVLITKILLMAPLIGRYRFSKLIFISPEDTIIPGSKVVHNDPDVERVRRAHLNDLENILPWMMSTMLWLTTSPEPEFAANLIKTFGICRIIHTFVYAVYPLPQPARFLAFAGGYIVTLYQTLSTICYYASQSQSIVECTYVVFHYTQLKVSYFTTMFLYNGTETSREFTALYSWWASLLLLQIMSYAWFTGRIRVRTGTIHSEEDRMWLENSKVKLHPNGGGNPELNDIRSGHLNDLSIILPYLIIAMIWLNTSPSPLFAKVILRIFPIAKIIDTVLYSKIIEIPKIFQHICIVIAYSILAYMIISCILFFRV